VPKIVAIHSFRRGTGKSNMTANLAALLAAEGKRIGVVDTDIQSPGMYILFKLPEEEISKTLNDYLRGNCEIKEAAYDVTNKVGTQLSGRLFLVPSLIRGGERRVGELTRVLKEERNVNVLTDGFHRLIKDLELDVLVVDAPPGLGESTLLSIAVSDALAIVMRPDQQDFQGTGVTVEVARKLDLTKIALIVNKAPPLIDLDELKVRIEALYECPVAAVLPHSNEMLTLASDGVFVAKYPDHPITRNLKQAATLLQGK
jgi:MinD-like ATPase involved in chromosome partitioning or flagellar assembly